MIQLLTQSLKKLSLTEAKSLTHSGHLVTSIRCKSTKDKPKKKWVIHKKQDIPIKLLQDVPFLGRAGESVKVKPGYMRNVLYSNKMAIYIPREHKQISKKELASQPQTTQTSQVKVMGHTYSSYLKLARLERELNRVHELSFIRSTITLGEPEIYGSVSIEDILNELRQNHKVNVDKDTCSWDKVKKVGIYSFKINLGNLGTYSLKINVKPEQLPPMPEVGGPEVNAQL